MNRHLSSTEVSAWVLGEREPDMDEHVRNCSVCRSEVARLEEVLTGFRGSVRAWSEDRFATARPEMPAPRANAPVARLGWATAALAVVVIASVSLIWPVHHRSQPESGAADAALFKEIDAQLSRTVPAPMEPLMKLVTWDAAPEPRLARKQ